MTVGNPENFKIQIKTGREDVDKRVPCDFTNLTLSKLFAWIDSQQLSSALKSELKRSASSFPHQALPSWQKDFDKYLSRAQSRLRKKKNSGKLPPTVPEPLEDKTNAHFEMKAPLQDEFDSDFNDNFDDGVEDNGVEDSVDNIVENSEDDQ